MKLNSATPSPRACKLRVALAETSAPFTLRTEVPWDDASLPRRNPVERLPVLLPDDGPSIWDSGFMLERTERTHPNLARCIDGLMARPAFQATTPCPQTPRNRR